MSAFEFSQTRKKKGNTLLIAEETECSKSGAVLGFAFSFFFLNVLTSQMKSNTVWNLFPTFFYSMIASLSGIFSTLYRISDLVLYTSPVTGSESCLSAIPRTCSVNQCFRFDLEKTNF